MKNFGDKEAWAYTGTAQFFGYPLLSHSVGLHSEGPSEQKPITIFVEKGAWAYPATAQFFGYPLLSQERAKLRASNFACTFIGSVGTKAH